MREGREFELNDLDSEHPIHLYIWNHHRDCIRKVHMTVVTPEDLAWYSDELRIAHESGMEIHLTWEVDYTPFEEYGVNPASMHFLADVATLEFFERFEHVTASGVGAEVTQSLIRLCPKAEIVYNLYDE